MRLFVAIEVPPPWREQALQVQMALAAEHGDALRLVAADALHLTVRFLGEVGEESLEALLAGLRALTVMPARLELARAGTFGAATRTSTVWLGVGGEVEALQTQFASLEETVRAAGLDSEERPFRPHLTLARVRPRTSATERRAIAQAVGALPEPPPSPFDARELALFRSHLEARGPRYEVLARVVSTVR